jgi:DNA-binding response OmpR family regulator
MGDELILLVDDEPNIIDFASLYLRQEGFRIISAEDGLAALEKIEKEQPDFIVLDLMLPKLNGWEVCKRVRAQSDLPILMLTARDDDIDKIVGLELGADDYMTKPFNPRELVARVKAILRRTDPRRLTSQPPLTRIQNLTIDPARRVVKVDDREIDLRTKEFDLLLALAENKGYVLSREKLLEIVWGFDCYGETRTVDVHIAHLRHKLKGSEAAIETVWGIGYRLEE